MDRAGVCSQVVKRVLTDYDKELVLLLSGTNTAHQAKAVLRMLTSFVMLGETSAREVVTRLPWSHDNWDTLVKRTSLKETPDVRTCFIHFLLSFLMDSSPSLVMEFLAQKTRLSSIFSGMVRDSSETVVLVLDTLKTKVLEHSGVKKTSKMKVFGSSTIQQILGLLKWTGPVSKAEAEQMDDLEENPSKELVLDSVTVFIRTLLCSKKHGVIFHDPALGQGEHNLNHLVKEVVTSMASSKPWEDVMTASLLVDISSSCPDQIPAVMSLLEKSWEVRDSSTWQTVIDLVLTILERLDMASVADSIPANSVILEKVVSNVLAPSKLLTQVIKPGLQMTDSKIVWSKCCQLLSIITANIQQLSSSVKPAQAQAVTSILSKSMRSVTSLGEVWSRVYSLMETQDYDTVLSIVSLTKYIISVHGLGQVSDSLNVGQLLAMLESCDNREMATNIQLKTLELINLLIVKSDRNVTMTSLSSICTEDTFKLLLDIIVSHEQSHQTESAMETFSGLVKSAGICLKSGMDLDLLLALGKWKASLKYFTAIYYFS